VKLQIAYGYIYNSLSDHAYLIIAISVSELISSQHAFRERLGSSRRNSIKRCT
jgi:hypothetical protein